MKILFSALFFFVVSNVALADYVTPEGNVEIAPGTGIYARESTAKRIRDLEITKNVIKLYEDVTELDDDTTIAKDENNCLFLYIDTNNRKKNFINQVIINRKKDCLI